MRSKISRRIIWVLLAALFALVGCSKQTRMERRLAAGDKQMAAGAFDVAEAEYRAALQLSPNDPKVFGRLGILSYKQGRVPSGYFLVQGALKSYPEDAELRLTFGLASLSMARTADARAAAKKVLQTQPTNEDAILLLVESCVTTRDNEEARRIIEELQAKNAGVAAYHVGLGALLLAQKEEARAEVEFRKALELDPKSSAANAQIGTIFLVRGDAKSAAGFLKTAAELSPLRAPRRMKYIDFLIRTGALDDAKKELKTVTEKARDYVPALILEMKLAFRDRQFEEADKMAKNVLALDRLNYDALMQRAAIKLVQNDPDGVIAALKNAETYYNRSPQIKYQLALAYLKKAEPALAEENLQQAILISPNYDEAIVLLAELHLKKGDPLSASTALTQVLQRTPGFTQAYVLLARANQALGNGNETLRILRLLSDMSPKAPESAYLLGMAQYQFGQAAEARASFERAVQNSETYWPALEMLIECDLQQNRKAAATERAEALIAKHADVAAPWLFRAKIRLFENNVDGAEADFLKAVAAEPENRSAALQLARLYYQLNRGQDAILKLNATVTQSNTASAQTQLGMLYSSLKQFDLARQAYEKALALDSRYILALNNLAGLLAENFGQVEQGLSLARKARDLAPGDPFVADTLGWIFFRRGQYESALPLLQASAEILPGDPDIQYHLALTHNQLGQEETARQIFQRVVNATAGSTVKEDARSRLAILAIDPAKATPAARAALEERLNRDSNDPAVLTRLGAIKEREGNAREAAQHYEAALKIMPRSFPSLLALVHLYVGPLKDTAKARELAKNAHNLQPTDGQAAWRFGRLIYEAGDFAWSITLLQEAARQLPNQPNVTFDLAQAQYSVGRITEAEASLKQSLASQNLANRESAQRMAAMIAATKSPALLQAALPEARSILAAEPNHIPALMVTALALEQQKDFRGAVQVYEKILAQNAVFATATRNLAIVHADQLGDDQKGEELALKARQTFNDDPELAFSLGAINYRKGDYTAAVRFLRQSLGKRPQHAETLFFLGMSLFQLKNVPESRAQLMEAIQRKLPPQEEREARRVLEEINRQG